MTFDRREFLKASAGAAGALSLAGVSGCATSGSAMGKGPKIVVVGAGFGGATFARYIKM